MGSNKVMTTLATHTVTTTKGRTIRTPFAAGQVWYYRGDRHVVERVFRKRVRFLIAKGSALMTCGQEPFAKHARLKLD